MVTVWVLVPDPTYLTELYMRVSALVRHLLLIGWRVRVVAELAGHLRVWLSEILTC